MVRTLRDGCLSEGRESSQRLMRLAVSHLHVMPFGTNFAAGCRTSATGAQLMLHSDMALLKDIFAGNADDFGTPTCTYDTCSAADTAALVQQLAANNTLFMSQFGDVYTRMALRGYEGCELAVVPSTGFGVTAEDTHGVSAVRNACAERGFAPPGTIVLGGSPPEDSSTPTDADAPVTTPPVAGPPPAGPGATPAEGSPPVGSGVGPVGSGSGPAGSGRRPPNDSAAPSDDSVRARALLFVALTILSL